MNNAGMQRFAVTLQFTDGEYKGTATAATEAAALNLAVIDARMGSFVAFFGQLVSHRAVPIPP